MEEAFMEENKSLIDQVGLLGIEENDNRLGKFFLGFGIMSIFFVFHSIVLLLSLNSISCVFFSKTLEQH
jgi:hypothetical protein